MKPIVFDINAQRTIKNFPKDIKIELGKLLFVLQEGEILDMPLSRPMPSVDKGVYELRIKDSSGNYRVFYYLKIKERILVFHAFMKKTQKTPQKEIETGKTRLSNLLKEVNI